ncbi:caspase-7 [Octopus bimaculoides]|uniref:Caspase family p20 domain-containing protein n=1 Tax=Octopus bimaculoides TaxID=37653 RepID=A0A0L8HCK5_OCTBM|nr:caspase-7 [Octopus bimaculoides]|eukprot:XP_014773818.1 PREDICTED: caspase-7-like [Octopus bimaculoides]
MTAKEVHYISKDQFVKIRVDFVKSMDDIDSFIDEAMANGLLVDGHRQGIMALRNTFDQVRQLHDYILRKLPDGSDKFVSALRKSGHHQILALLDDPSFYPMKFKPHGRVIIINNIDFDDKKYEKRSGSEKDVEGIKNLFTAFNFDVDLYSNKTAKEMEDIILKRAAESTATEDCFVMFLMSHGVVGNIIGTDGNELSYITINNALKESSHLKDKPKLIYINTCQINSNKKNVREYFNVPDLYVAFATVPENLAFRTDESGSVFIKSLLTVYERNKEECNVFSLSPEINSQISKEFDQISSSYSTLKKKVILRATD